MTEKKNVALRLPLYLVAAVDRYASKVGVTRTTAIIILLTNALADFVDE